MLLFSETYIVNADISQCKNQSVLYVNKYNRRNPDAANTFYGAQAEEMYEKLTGNTITRDSIDSDELTTRESRIEQLKIAAESIIKNAESIIGDEENQTDVTISISLTSDSCPTININKNFLP